MNSREKILTIADLRERGKPWAEVGAEVGLSAVAAKKRYHRWKKKNKVDAKAAAKDEKRSRFGEEVNGTEVRVSIIGRPTSLDIPIEEVWQTAFKAQDLVEREVAARLSQTLTVDPPFALAFISDLHFGSPYTDYKGARRDAQIIADTPGMYAGFGGDGVDNWIVGKLKELQRAQAMNFDREWRLFFDWLETLGPNLLYVVSGNHENWTHAVAGFDRVQEALDGTKVLYHPQQIIFTLRVGDEHKQIVKVRHKWPFGSVFNSTHSIEVGWERGGDDFDIGLAGHVHTGTYFREFSRHNRPRMAVQIGTYKINDKFGDQLGKGKPFASGCGALVFDKDGGMFPTRNLEVAAKYLRSLQG